MTHAWSTPLPHVYIHGQLHRSVTDSVNHIQLPLMALTWVTKILINVFRQGRCQTRVKVFVIFYNGDDRNDRNDKETEKSYVGAIARGLWINCHYCHFCHCGDIRLQKVRFKDLTIFSKFCLHSMSCMPNKVVHPIIALLNGNHYRNVWGIWLQRLAWSNACVLPDFLSLSL